MYKKGSVVYRDYRAPEGEDKDATAIATAEPSAPTQPPERKEQQQEEEQRETTAVPKLKSKTQREKEEKRAKKAKIVIEHVDIMGDEFWKKRPWLLGSGS